MVSNTQARSDRTAQVGRRYPRKDTLQGGREVTARLMTADDRDLILRFARSLPPDDLLYLRRDITDEGVVDEWIARIAAQRRITVLVFGADNELLGEASLTHSETDWTRHLGDIRMIVSLDARGEGLGRYLAEEIFVAAEVMGLQRLAARMTNDQVGAQAVFRGLGFEAVAVLPGFVITGDGQKRDLLVMAYDVPSRGAPNSVEPNV